MQDKELKLPDYLQIPGVLIEDQAITALDGMVYGLVYWYKRLKLEKCILSNPQFAKLLKVEVRSVQRSLSRLEHGGYIKIIYRDALRKQRLEIIPLITFQTHPVIDDMTVESYDRADAPEGTTAESYKETDDMTSQSYQKELASEGMTEKSYGYDPTVIEVRPYSHHNKNTEEKGNNKNNISSNEEIQQAVESGGVKIDEEVLEGEVASLPKSKSKSSGKRRDPNPDGTYGDPSINAVKEHFLKVTNLEREDCTQRESRLYWKKLLDEVKDGYDKVEGVKKLINIIPEDEQLAPNITSSRALYYKKGQLLSRYRARINKSASTKTETGATVAGGIAWH